MDDHDENRGLDDRETQEGTKYANVILINKASKTESITR